MHITIQSIHVGKVPVMTAVYSWESLEEKFHNVEMGGRYRPTHCTARHRVAIVVPFRDREIHLKILLNNLHPFLQNQQLDYAIFIVDLMPEVTFNRAMLLNIGFTEALKQYDYQCFIFHDVDLIPEMGHNMYSCPENPRHMSVAIDTMNYRLPYNNIFGGVVAMTKEQFQQVNGFSNKYFGWGGEDDDMFNRIRHNNMSITRYPVDVSRYKMLSHRKELGNPDRFRLLQGSKKRLQKDGLNSLKYSRQKLELRKLYTYLLVDIDEVYIMSNGLYNRSHHQQYQHKLQQQFQEQQVDI
ncbi:Beta-1,4-N-acetylgalactosaminyltransferase bre-4 [Mizuhopecten yessoensis]|uniref:Beta-1,4-N-acetylgalactosaminyltransferase bre-4 n=1 Tax=Mizuhopecten yessoensis TaxID=6573 RepID=A0A210Q5C6_MIZYE|nr:Beta-1,4-N-acetylgalactosaminyltransferase bre-4 [Mizuhopecten yessoensis]